MHERVVANWLTNANELAYTLPFCQILTSKGQKIIKVSPKKATLEEGKDVIALDKKGKPQCYQLKGGNLSLKDWRNEVKGQVEDMLDIMPVSPSLGDVKDWDCFLVLNGELKGEVAQVIKDYNNTRKLDKKRTFQVITIGELERDFIEYFGSFIPTELKHFEIFLDLYNATGDDLLDVDKLSPFWRTYFGDYLKEDKKTKLNKNELSQLINASLVINSYILGKKYNAENHIAIIQGWLVLLNTIYAVAERYELDPKYFKGTAELIRAEVYERNHLLIPDIISSGLIDRKNGTAVSEALIFRQRYSQSIGFTSMLLMAEIIDGATLPIEKELVDWIINNAAHLRLETEAEIPGALSVALHLLISKREGDGEVLLGVIVKSIIKVSYANGIPDPYHDFVQVLKHRLGVRLLDNLDETFERSSYTLWPLIHTVAFLHRREMIQDLWREVSHVQFRNFTPAEPWRYFLRYSEKGLLESRYPKDTQSWAELVEKSKEMPDDMPKLLVDQPGNLFLLWAVYPHRFNEQTIRIFLNGPLKDT